MKVIVEQDVCVGHGVCEWVAPAIFTLGDDMVSQVLVDDLAVDQCGPATEAVASCPAQALRITA